MRKINVFYDKSGDDINDLFMQVIINYLNNNERDTNIV